MNIRESEKFRLEFDQNGKKEPEGYMATEMLARNLFLLPPDAVFADCLSEEEFTGFIRVLQDPEEIRTITQGEYVLHYKTLACHVWHLSFIVPEYFDVIITPDGWNLNIELYKQDTLFSSTNFTNRTEFIPYIATEMLRRDA